MTEELWRESVRKILAKEREEAEFQRIQIESLEAEARHGDTAKSRSEAQRRLLDLKYAKFRKSQNWTF